MRRILSVIVPAFNEADTIETLMETVLAAPYEKEILVVDDGSTDTTGKILARFSEHPGVRVLRHRETRGKGSAVRTALSHVTGQVTLIQDADLEYDPADYPKLIEPILGGEEKVVFGTRIPLARRHSYYRYYLGGRLVSTAANLLYGQNLTDAPCGYKAFETEFLRALPLRSRRFDFDAEVTALTALRGIRIREVPVRYRPRSFAEGKKIRWTDGLAALWILARLRVKPGPGVKEAF